MPDQQTVVVIGAGPAGLTAAFELASGGLKPIVFEKDDIVGGLARTEQYRGYFFDMGGHRFFTKCPEVEHIWHELLKGDFLLRPRLSRIYYNGRYFSYPLKLHDIVSGLGIVESLRILASYAMAKMRPHAPEVSFRHWVSNRFGARLFDTFFRSYTEKVWGISTDELDAEWAVQRIKNLSLRSAVMSLIVSPGRRITSLIEEFHYPRRGPGMMWEAMRRRIEALGGEVHLGQAVTRLDCEGSRVTSVTVRDASGERTLPTATVVSSMAITDLIRGLGTAPPDEVRRAASALSYRDFLTVALIIDRAELFPDNWIYVHEPSVKVARIQNFKNWSPDMVPDSSKTSLGLEYFCNENDEFWTRSDQELVELAKREVDALGLARASEVIDGCVFRMAKAYPVYDSAYRQYMEAVREYVGTFENMQTIGRNGLHRYNNQDHAMLTGLLAARNVLEGTSFDLFEVNTDQAYHETIDERVGRRPPVRAGTPAHRRPADARQRPGPVSMKTTSTVAASRTR